MPMLSEATAAERWNVPGMVEGIAAEVDGYSVDRERWDVDIDFTFTFKGLPNDLCPAHHVGYVVSRTAVDVAGFGEEPCGGQCVDGVILMLSPAVLGCNLDPVGASPEVQGAGLPIPAGGVGPGLCLPGAVGALGAELQKPANLVGPISVVAR